MQPQLHDAEAKADPAIAAEQLLQMVGRAADQTSAPLLAAMQSGDFELDGLRILFTKQQAGPAGYSLRFHAQVGVLPFTAEGRGQREALMMILDGAQALRHARFRCDGHSIMLLESRAEFGHDPGDADIIMALIAMQQEAAPFLALIARHL